MVGPVLFVVFDVFLLISLAALAIAQASQVARNVTTNELANWHRCAQWGWARMISRARAASSRGQSGVPAHQPTTPYTNHPT